MEALIQTIPLLLVTISFSSTVIKFPPSIGDLFGDVFVLWDYSVPPVPYNPLLSCVSFLWWSLLESVVFGFKNEWWLFFFFLHFNNFSISFGTVDKLQASWAFSVCTVSHWAGKGREQKMKGLLWNLSQDPKVPTVLSHLEDPRGNTCFSWTFLLIETIYRDHDGLLTSSYKAFLWARVWIYNIKILIKHMHVQMYYEALGGWHKFT